MSSALREFQLRRKRRNEAGSRVAQLIGDAISEQRREANATQEDLSALAGIGRSQIANIERGNSLPSIKTLLSICDALECSPASLLPTLEEVRSE